MKHARVVAGRGNLRKAGHGMVGYRSNVGPHGSNDRNRPLNPTAVHEQARGFWKHNQRVDPAGVTP